MLEILQDCVGTNVAIQTTKGTSFDGYLRKVSRGMVFVDVKETDGSQKGTFILAAIDVYLLVKLSGVTIAREVRVS